MKTGPRPFTLLATLLCLVMSAGAPLASAHEDREPSIDRDSHEGRDDREASEDHSGHGSGDERTGDRHGSGSGSGQDGGSHSGRGEDRAERGPRIDLERDERGERVRGEVVVLGSPRDLASIQAAGLTVLDERTLASIDARLIRVQVPRGSSTRRFIAHLRQLTPEASVTSNHVFRMSGTPATATAASDPPSIDPTNAIGIIDTGIERATAQLQRSLQATRGFGPGGYVPAPHGTVVGEIASRGGAVLTSADVFGIDSRGRYAATTAALVQAMDWLLERRMRVINISIEGPDNPLLARMIRRAVDGDVAVVAAAGNRGPAAPPAYPAAYPGVIAVTAVDEQGRIYRRANQGAYILFSARGVHVAPASSRCNDCESGTSFAAPVIAAVLAARFRDRPGERVGDAVSSLARVARDLGTPGRDAVYGWGEIVP